MCWPYFQALAGTIGALTFISIWFVTCDFSSLMKKWSLDLFFVLFFFVSFIPYALTGSLEYGAPGPAAIVKWMPLFLFGIFVNHYYQFRESDHLFLGQIALVSLVTSGLGSLQSSFMLRSFPTAARLLAKGTLESREFFLSIGIGGFGFTYATMFLVTGCIYLVILALRIRRKEMLLLSVLSTISMIVAIVSASYTISILMLVGGIILLVIFFMKKVFFFLSPIITALVLMSSREDLGRIVGRFSEAFNDNYTLYYKLNDLSSWLLGEGRTIETGMRFDLYRSSLITFLENPVFGSYGPFSSYGMVGGHSGLLDLLAFYGIFSALPLVLAIMLNFRKQLRFFRNSNYSKYLMVTQIMFVVLAFLNPILYVYQIGFMMFAILPSLPFLPSVFGRQSEAKKIERGWR